MRERARMRMCVSERACVPVCATVRVWCLGLRGEGVRRWLGAGAAHQSPCAASVSCPACLCECARTPVCSRARSTSVC